MARDEDRTAEPSRTDGPRHALEAPVAGVGPVGLVDGATPAEGHATARTPLPAEIRRALARLQSQRRRLVVLDGVASGALAAAALGAPVGVGLDLAGIAPDTGIILGALGGLAVAGHRVWRGRLGLHGAALELDRLLGAKDRFASALDFSGRVDPEGWLGQQMAEATRFLAAAGPVPPAPPPPWSAGRWGLAAACASGLALAAAWWFPSLVTALEAATETDADRTPAQIAEEAHALQERITGDPLHRIDAEVNALEQALARARTQVRLDRTEALERAADALERAMGTGHAERVEDGASTETGEPPAGEPPAGEPPAAEARTVEGPPPEGASEGLAQAWARAQDARQAWQDAARRTDAAPAAVAQLQAEAQRTQLDALSRAAQEEGWAHADPATDGPGEEGTEQEVGGEREAGTALADAMNHLDRAIGRLDRRDGDDQVPGDEVGRGLTEASAATAEHTPETSQALADAADARARGDAEAMDDALERAREALQREAGRETDGLAEARQRLQDLHDEVAAQQADAQARAQPAPAETEPQRGQSQQAPAGTEPQQGQAQQAPAGTEPQQGQAQSAQAAGQPQQGTSQQAQAAGQPQQGQAQSTQAAGQPQQGQAQSAQAAGQPQQGTSQQAQAAGQPQPGPTGTQAQPGSSPTAQAGATPQQGQAAGQAPGQADEGGHGAASAAGAAGDPGQGRGEGAAGDPRVAEGTDDGAPVEGVQIDPGGAPDAMAQLGVEPDPRGLLPGAGPRAGHLDPRMEGHGGGRSGSGNGALAPGVSTPPRGRSGNDIPGSLRAYVQRYLRALQGEDVTEPHRGRRESR